MSFVDVLVPIGFALLFVLLIALIAGTARKSPLERRQEAQFRAERQARRSER